MNSVSGGMLPGRSWLLEWTTLALQEHPCQNRMHRGQRSICYEWKSTDSKENRKGEFGSKSRQAFGSKFRNKVSLSTFTLMTGSTYFRYSEFGKGLGKGWQLKFCHSSTKLFQENLRQSWFGLGSSKRQQEPWSHRLRGHRKGMLSNPNLRWRRNMKTSDVLHAWEGIGVCVRGVNMTEQLAWLEQHVTVMPV